MAFSKKIRNFKFHAEKVLKMHKAPSVDYIVYSLKNPESFPEFKGVRADYINNAVNAAKKINLDEHTLTIELNLMRVEVS